MLAQQFDVVSLQEMRSIIMEGSTMRTFLRGEVFELAPHEVGILLEGFAKKEGSNEILAAPAGLTFSNGETHLTPSGRSSSLILTL